MPTIPKTKSGSSGAVASGTTPNAESDLRTKGRRLMLRFSQGRLEKLEYTANTTEAPRPQTMSCAGRDGSGQFRWCGYSRALAVVLLLCKISKATNPKVRGKKAKSAVSSFLDIYDKANNPFNNYPLFQSKSPDAPESATLNQVFYSSKGNDKHADARWVGLDAKRLQPDCIEVCLAHGAQKELVTNPNSLLSLARGIEQEEGWTPSECAVQNPAPCELSKQDNWEGEWLCRWSPKKPNDNGWITERVRLSHKSGKLKIDLIEPGDDYRWEAWAKVKGRYLIGEWRSLKLHSTSRGTVQLTATNQGNSLLGYLVGPHINNRMTIYRFILAEEAAELERVTRDFKKLL
jgi:hypothetical protein